MIKVMHISSSLQHGGLERMIYNFAVGLDQKRYLFSVCALDTGGVFADEIRKIGAQVSVLRKRQGVDPRLWLWLYRLFKKEKIDVVHTHNFSPLFYCVIPARLAGVKAVVHTEHARTAFPDVKRRMIAERYLSLFVDTITAVSPQVKQDLIHYEGISAEKVQMIWNGIETKLPVPMRSADLVRKDLGISPTAPVVGVCCRLMEQKGVRYLLESAQAILKAHPQTIFLIVGDGNLRPSLQELAVKLKLESHVMFTGFRSDVNDLLSVFDVYVLPSLFEGTPLGLLEAMLHGKSAVVTTVGSNAEIIHDGISGTLVDPKRPDQLSDAINRLLSNADTRKEIGQKARERVLSLFSLDRMLSEYESLYESLLSRC